MSFTFILDIGKTNIKALVLDTSGEARWSRQRANDVIHCGPYPHFDVDGIWQWLLKMLAEAVVDYRIEAINVSTHGACAVLLDTDGKTALPVLDYESALPETISEQYGAVRPAFADSLSPDLPVGLNLGRQLWWLRDQYPQDFARTAMLLCYPQYWVWRLTGVAVSERTSLACHTDLWHPLDDQYSPLLAELGLQSACPPLENATEAVGTVTTEVIQATGLSAQCRVFAGVHDSNASYARYLASGKQLGETFSVVSTGTWFVTMSRNGNCHQLDESRDTLANVDVTGRPLACARFMGGREYEQICERLGGGYAFTIADTQAVIDTGAMALPAFAAAGPFNGRECSLSETFVGGAQASALASLYLALMVDYELDLLQASGSIVFGSLSQRNPQLCSLLAALRPGDRVLLSGDSASTALGAWCLTRWGQPLPASMLRFDPATPLNLRGLANYRKLWRQSLGVHLG